MSLLPPKVFTPVSECSPFVRTQAQISTATVRVFADGTLVAEQEASSADTLISLLPGVTLEAGQRLTATQSLNGETSEPSPTSVVVQARPPSLPVPAVGFAHVCSECLLVTGILPGARVEVEALQGPNAGLRGGTDRAWLTLQVPLDPAASEGENLLVRQDAPLCNLTSDRVGVLAGSPPPRELPPPILIRPLKACQTAVRFREVIPGAVVTIERSAGNDVVGCVSNSTGYFVIPPLQANESLRISQGFPACRLDGAFSSPELADDVEPVEAPIIAGMFDQCEGTTSLHLRNLIPTAQVEIVHGTRTIGRGEVPPDVTHFAFPVPNLPAGAAIFARQGLCGHWSPDSDTLTLRDGQTVEAPSVPGPLHPCASVVRVVVPLGYGTVTVHSQLVEAPIGHVDFWSTSGFIDVPVAPTLVEGDTITASMKGCGGDTNHSEPVVVGPHGAVEQPIIPLNPPLQAGMSFVPVTNVTPGAWVEVFVDGEVRGSGALGGSQGAIPITGTLAVGQLVGARQRICARTSAVGTAVEVQHRLPVADFNPVPGTGRAPLTVNFQNQSLYANHPTEQFLWHFEDVGDGTGPTSNEANPSHTYPEPGTYTATLTASNASNWHSIASKTIVVQEALPDEDEEKAVSIAVTPAGPAHFDPDNPVFSPYRADIWPRPGERLVRIENPTNRVLHIIKQGGSTADCGMDDKVVVLGSGGILSPDDLEEIYGEKQPKADMGLGLALCVVALTGSALGTNFSITAVFVDDN